MKSYDFYTVSLILIFLSILLISCNDQEMQQEKVNISGQELWEKTIAYHDPNGKWDSYAGKMHMVTVIGKNQVFEEIIEINKTENFYKCTWIDKDTEVIKGIKNGEYFFGINEDSNPSEQLKSQYGLSEDNTSSFKEHHTCHFGLPMELKTSGMTVEENVEVVEHDGRKYFALTFIGMPDKVKHLYYEGKLVLYIDPVTFGMRKIERESTKYPPDYTILSGEIDVNNVIIPHMKGVFRSEDDIHRWSSIYTTIKN